MRNITVFYDGSFYTFKWLKPLFWASKEIKELGYRIKFKNIFEYLPIKNKLNKLPNNASGGDYDIVMLAFHHSGFDGVISRESFIDILDSFKKRCNCLIWMDTSDSTGTAYFEFLPYVDLYFKKQYLVDTERYRKPIWGGRIFCEYYHEKYSLEDEEIGDKDYATMDPSYEYKLRLSWNVGLGDLFSGKYRSYLFPKNILNPPYIQTGKECMYDVHFRGSAWSTAAGYQRMLARNAIAECESLRHPDAEKKVPHNEYMKEIKSSFSIISPFGWGEICTRDFEAFAYGSVLLKPDVSHMVTFPNWYVKDETYISIDWDFKNISDIFAEIREDTERYQIIASNGQELLRKYRDTDFGKRIFAEHLIQEIEKEDSSS